MNINQRSGNDPEIDSLLRSTDPLTNSVEEAMSASRKNTACIPSSGFSPVINQRPATASAYEEAPAGEHSPAHGFISPEWTPETIENNRPHRSGKQRATAASHRIKRLTFALAASLALIAGALFLGPWGNSPAPAPPASPIHTRAGQQGCSPLVLRIRGALPHRKDPANTPRRRKQPAGHRLGHGCLHHRKLRGHPRQRDSKTQACSVRVRHHGATGSQWFRFHSNCPELRSTPIGCSRSGS